MASLWDSVNLTSCFWFPDPTNVKRATAAIISGLLFSIGWWLMIDANVVHPSSVSAGYYVWGALGTISLIMVNVTPIRSDNMSFDGGLLGNGTNVWLFVAFVLGFASVFASVWIFFTDFYRSNDSKVPGVQLLMQNVLVFVSSIIYRFCRDEEY